MQDPEPLTMEPYVYSRLDGESQIRLLHLLPGPTQSETRIHIEKVELSPEHTPQYEALSYVWGSVEDPANVIVTFDADKTPASEFRTLNLSEPSSSSRYKSLSITRNLAEALPYLRDTTKPRTLWIDAICIDQQNLSERGEQVSKMGDIYSLANRVLVWLGLETPDSSLAMQLLNAIGSQATVEWATATISSASGTDDKWSNTVAEFRCRGSHACGRAAAHIAMV